MAGQAGLELVEANELLNERIVVLEEEADSAQTMMQFQRDEIKQLTHELGRTRAGRDRSNVLLKEADEERDRLQHILAENETSHHLALNAAHKHLEDARKMEVNVHSDVESSETDSEEEEEEGKSNSNNSNNSNKKNKKYNHPNNHHHHLNKAATDASDHVSRTLQLSHEGLKEEALRHHQLISKRKKGLISNEDFRHHQGMHPNVFSSVKNLVHICVHLCNRIVNYRCSCFI